MFRWIQLFAGQLAVQRLLAGKGEELDKATQLAIDEWAEKYRARLGDLFWFMRVLNESIARKANAEDQVTGHFWEGRFKSQALLDEQAVLTAMAYVDLNPIRAQMAETPEDSDHTSVAERIAQLKSARAQKPQTTPPANPAQTTQPAPSPAIPIVALKGEAHLAELPLQPLMPFDATARLKAAIPFAFDDDLDLVETTGRCLREDKRGAIAEHTPALLHRLNIDPERFIDCATGGYIFCRRRSR